MSYGELLQAEARATANRRRPLRVALIFLFVFLVLRLLWALADGTGFERMVIHDLITRPAAWVIQQVWPDHGAVARGHQILAPVGRLNILVGCDGLETLFLLVAAFVAYPFSWRARMLGIGLGAVLVYGLNVGRIAWLWQAWISDRAVLALLHGIVLPMVMIVFCLAYFLLFLARNDTA